MVLTRRIFLKNSAMAMVATTAVPAFLARAVYGAETGGGKKKLVVIFQRGAADGLNVIVPHGEAAYYSMRPTIAIPRPSRGQESCIDLDGFFGMHPSLDPLKPLWDARHLALVHASGSPDITRSHFDAQDYMESGTPGAKATEDGWLNRCMQSESENDATPFRAVALGSSLPRILSGRAPAVAIDNVRNFAVGGGGPAATPISNDLEAMYSQSVDAVLHGTGNETFEAVKMLKSADPNNYQPASGATYPRGRFGDALRQAAQLLKANLGVEVAFTDIGGWDHHVNEGSTQGQLANLLREFSQSLAAFWIDLGPIAADTVVVTMSEFGRKVRGGRMYGRWPGPNDGQLYGGRDLAVTTDFRRVLGEAVYRHLGNREL